MSATDPLVQDKGKTKDLESLVKMKLNSRQPSGPSASKLPQTQAELMAMVMGNTTLAIGVTLTLTSIALFCWYEAEHIVTRLSFAAGIGTGIAVLAMVAAAHATYHLILSEQMKDQIDQFRKQNLDFKRQNKAMRLNIDDLERVADEMKKQVKAFESLRNDVQKHADKMGAGFEQTMTNLNEFFRKMDQLTSENMRLLFLKHAQDVEYSDRSPGFVAWEFENFCDEMEGASLLAESKQLSFKKIYKFEDHAEDGAISHKKMVTLIDDFISKVYSSDDEEVEAKQDTVIHAQ